MPETRERPGGETGAATEDTIRTSVTDAADYVADLARRRAASRRLPVLDCGCGDPWHHIPLPPSQRNLLAARRAQWHLTDHGLRSELTEAVLAEGVAS